MSGLVGTFDDSIPEGQFPEGMGGTRSGDPNSKAYWASWAIKQVAKAADEDEKRRKEAAAAAESAAQKGTEEKRADTKAGDKTPAKTGEAPAPGDGPKPTADGSKTGGPTPGTPIATPAMPGAAK